MKTGFKFFDEYGAKPGDLWILGSGPGMGKSTVLRNLAVGIADHLTEGDVAYWDLERTPASWRKALEKMRPDVPEALQYRNSNAWQDGYLPAHIISVLNEGAGSTVQAVIVDHFNLFTHDLDVGLKTLKTWLVRTSKFGVVGASLPRSLWRQMQIENTLDPTLLPENLLDNGDSIFVCNKKAPDSLRVIACKTPTTFGGLSEEVRFSWEPATGRIS